MEQSWTPPGGTVTAPSAAPPSQPVAAPPPVGQPSWPTPTAPFGAPIEPTPSLAAQMFLGKGRLPRLGYLAWLAGVFAATFGVSFVVGFAVGITGGSPESGAALAQLVTLPITWVSICAGIRRLHDMGKSGWTMLCVLIPIVNIGLLLFLLFNGGEERPNEYGPQSGQV